MTAIDLSKFCDPGNRHPFIRAPWSHDGFIYAVSPVTMIRVPGTLPGDPPENYANALKTWGDAWPKHPMHFRPTRHVLEPLVRVRCQECDAARPNCMCDCTLNCTDGHFLEEPDDEPLQMSGCKIAPVRLRQLIALPALQFGECVAGSMCLPFIFEGGQGILAVLSHEHGPPGKLEPEKAVAGGAP